MANQFTRCPDRSHLWCAPPHLIACSLIFFSPIRSSKIASHCKKNANLSISEPSRLTSDHFFFRKNTRDPPLKNSHVEVVLFDVTDTSQKKSIRTGKPASTSIKQKPKPGASQHGWLWTISQSVELCRHGNWMVYHLSQILAESVYYLLCLNSEERWEVEAFVLSHVLYSPELTLGIPNPGTTAESSEPLYPSLLAIVCFSIWL